VPAQLAGLWCAGGFSLRLQQTFQMLQGELARGALRRAIDARIEGAAVPLKGPDGGARLELRNAQLAVMAASGGWSALRGTVFRRSDRAECR